MLAFEYIDQVGKRSHRVVEPYRLRLMEMHWYLLAYSLERNDYRTFKLTRMIDIQKEGSFSPRSDNGFKKDNKYSGESKLVPLQLLVDVSVRDQFIERYGKISITEVTQDSYLAKIELPENRFAFQFIAGFGNKVKILKPLSFIESYLTFLEETIGLYK